MDDEELITIVISRGSLKTVAELAVNDALTWVDSDGDGGPDAAEACLELLAAMTAADVDGTAAHLCTRDLTAAWEAGQSC